MKKPIFLRISGLLVLYCAVFIGLVAMQFPDRGSFSKKAGNITVKGRSDNGEAPDNAGKYLLRGGALAEFGGIEFNLDGKGDKSDGFTLIYTSGERRQVFPESMVLSGNTVRFYLPGGAELIFVSLKLGTGPELRIGAVFTDAISGIELPFKTLESTMPRGERNRDISYLYENIRYQFDPPIQGEESGRVLLNNTTAVVVYKAVSGQVPFNPGDFFIPGAETVQTFTGALDLWKNTIFTRWGENSASRDEDTILAQSAEALERGDYETVFASIPQAFLSGNQRSYQSSVYFGGMAQAYRGFAAAERDEINRITRLINTRSPELLKEDHLFDFLSIRGLAAQITNAAAFIRSINADDITLEETPAVFEGFADMNRLRPSDANPFEHLIEQSCLLAAEGIEKDSYQEKIFVYHNGVAETEFNLRLGRAISLWAESNENSEWAALGRSLVLSVLALTDDQGTAAAALARSCTGEAVEEGAERTSGAVLYRLLSAGSYYPKAALILAGTNNVWAWTAASNVSGVQENNTLSISVSFPANQTHYMIIRGVRPFSRLQLYGMNYRSDPQFERYDSPGWAYYSQDQILVLKMKHRETIENIRIDFTPAPAPVPPSSAETGIAPANSEGPFVTGY